MPAMAGRLGLDHAGCEFIAGIFEHVAQHFAQYLGAYAKHQAEFGQQTTDAAALQPVRCHQMGDDDARIQAQCDQLAGSVVGAGAGLHGNQTTGW